MSLRIRKYYMKHSTHSEVLDYLNTIGFSSKGLSIYDSTYATSLVTEAQSYDYFYKNIKILRIANSVIKLSEDEHYVFTVQASNYTTSTYADLINDTCDSTIMNQFSSVKERSDSFNIINYCTSYPSGYTENYSYVLTNRPSIGSSQSSVCQYNGDIFNAETNTWTPVYERHVEVSTYVFWIGVGKRVLAGSYSATPCT